MSKITSRRALLQASAFAGGAAIAAGLGSSAFAQFGQIEGEMDPYMRRALNIPEGQDLPPDAYYGPWRTMRGVQERRVIDMHCHSYETRTQGRNYAETAQRHESGDFIDTSDGMIASFDRHGIAKGTLIPAFVPFEQVVETSYARHRDRYILTAGLPTREMVRQGKTINDLEPAELAAIYRRMFTEFRVSHIGESAGGGLRALSQRLGPRACAPVIDVILEFDAPVHFDPGSWSPTGTARGIGAYSSGASIAEVAAPLIASYPDVKFIVAHAGGQFWQLDGQMVTRLLFSLDNTYTEISKTFDSETITTIVRGIGPERVMYGSDWNRPQMKTYGPYHLRAAYQHWNSLNTLARANLNEDERDWVLWKSAHKLLKLDERANPPRRGRS
jgi:predicted TIM-barrel fold metal-dependent hydrolase